MPIFTSDVSSVGISTTVDNDAHNNEDLTKISDRDLTIDLPELTTMVMTLSKLSQYSSCDL